MSFGEKYHTFDHNGDPLRIVDNLPTQSKELIEFQREKGEITEKLAKVALGQTSFDWFSKPNPFTPDHPAPTPIKHSPADNLPGKPFKPNPDLFSKN